LCVVVGVVVGVLLVAGLAVELPDLPPHPAIATVLPRTITSGSMAVSGVLFMGRAPIIA
jgi:hypothetical protein